MKASIAIVLAISSLLLISGCSLLFPQDSPIPPSPEEAATGQVSTQKSQEKSSDSDAAASDLIAQMATAEKKNETANVTNITNTTEAELQISGSLKLQTDATLCPHLNTSFSCDKYDIRRCDFKDFVGVEGYYPDLINCRAGRKDKGENPDYRYCLIQECQPISEENLAYEYGGPTIFAEYEYREEKVAGGIMTYYTLKRCGEQQNTFNSSFDCTVYKSRLDKLWS